MQGLSNKALLLVHRDVVKDGLDGVSALLMATDLDEVIFDVVKDLEALLNRTIRQQLLKEVVAILINHYVGKG